MVKRKSTLAAIVLSLSLPGCFHSCSVRQDSTGSTYEPNNTSYYYQTGPQGVPRFREPAPHVAPQYRPRKR